MRIPRRISATGLLGAILALVSQIALGSLVIADDAVAAQRSALAAASILCVAGHDPRGGTTPHRPHAPESAICPLSLALAAPSFVLTPTASPPDPPPVLDAAVTRPPPARGPPSKTARVGSPRGPPSLS